MISASFSCFLRVLKSLTADLAATVSSLIHQLSYIQPHFSSVMIVNVLTGQNYAPSTTKPWYFGHRALEMGCTATRGYGFKGPPLTMQIAPSLQASEGEMHATYILGQYRTEANLSQCTQSFSLFHTQSYCIPWRYRLQTR